MTLWRWAKWLAGRDHDSSEQREHLQRLTDRDAHVERVGQEARDRLRRNNFSEMVTLAIKGGMQP